MLHLKFSWQKTHLAVSMFSLPCRNEILNSKKKKKQLPIVWEYQFKQRTVKMHRVLTKELTAQEYSSASCVSCGICTFGRLFKRLRCPENSMLSEINQTQKNSVWFQVHEVPWVGEFMENKCYWGLREGGRERHCFRAQSSALGGGQALGMMVLESATSWVNERHHPAHLKMAKVVHFMLRLFYPVKN